MKHSLKMLGMVSVGLLGCAAAPTSEHRGSRPLGQAEMDLRIWDAHGRESNTDETSAAGNEQMAQYADSSQAMPTACVSASLNPQGSILMGGASLFVGPNSQCLARYGFTYGMSMFMEYSLKQWNGLDQPATIIDQGRFEQGYVGQVDGARTFENLPAGYYQLEVTGYVLNSAGSPIAQSTTSTGFVEWVPLGQDPSLPEQPAPTEPAVPYACLTDVALAPLRGSALATGRVFASATPECDAETSPAPYGLVITYQVFRYNGLDAQALETLVYENTNAAADDPAVLREVLPQLELPAGYYRLLLSGYVTDSEGIGIQGKTVSTEYIYID